MTATPPHVMRQHAEQQYAEELAQLRRQDTTPRPENWAMSPWAVVTYLMGGTLADGFVVGAKYIGDTRLNCGRRGCATAKLYAILVTDYCVS